MPAEHRLSTLSRSIRGDVAIVTGAGSGMGRATAHLFADEGASVAVIDRNGDAAAAVADEITGAGLSARAWTLDVADAQAVRTVVEEVVAQFGSLRIVVNNAGISQLAPIGDDSYPDAWTRNLAVNLSGQVNVIRAALPHLRAAEHARIVNIASTEGLGATALNSPYAAAKHGVIGLTRALAVELGREGITVNCVCPGPINTGMTAGIPEEAKTKFARRRVPLRRYGEPEEVAHATLALVLPSASFLTGVALPVDGGLVIQNT
jgi:3-oxoacyl-[acyl-carrier protein] reductase